MAYSSWSNDSHTHFVGLFNHQLGLVLWNTLSNDSNGTKLSSKEISIIMRESNSLSPLFLSPSPLTLPTDIASMVASKADLSDAKLIRISASGCLDTASLMFLYTDGGQRSTNHYFSSSHMTVVSTYLES